MKQKWLFLFLWPNLAVAATALVLTLAGEVTSLASFTRFLLPALAYANVVTLLACAVAAGFGKAWPLRPVPLLAIAVVVIVPLGCLLVQVLLLAMGAVERHHFWSAYLFTQRFAIPAALVFGLGAVTDASLRQRLHTAETKLHEQQLAGPCTRSWTSPIL